MIWGNFLIQPANTGQVKDPQMSVNDYIDEMTLKTHIFYPDKTLIEFIHVHAEEILDIALTEGKSDRGSKAFLLLTLRPAEIMENRLFFIRASDFLRENPKCSCIISRISELLLRILKIKSEYVEEALGFLYRLIPFIDNTGVYDLFYQITMPDFPNVKVQELLCEINFADFLLTQIRNDSISYEKIGFLLDIFRHCIKSPSLNTNIDSETAIELFEKLSESENVLMLGYLWQTISTLCTKSTVYKMNNLRKIALRLVSEPYMRLHPYHIGAFDFLGKYLYYKPMEFVHDIGIIDQLIVRLFNQFPDSVNLIGSLSRLFRSGINTDLAPRMMDDLFTFFIVLAQDKQRTAAAAHAALIVNDVVEKRFTSKMIFQFLKQSLEYQKCRERFLPAYNTLIYANYGGSEEKLPNNKTKVFAIYGL